MYVGFKRASRWSTGGITISKITKEFSSMYLYNITSAI